MSFFLWDCFYWSASFIFLKIVYFVLFLFWLACVLVLRNWVFYILFYFYVLMEINLLGLILRIYFILKWILIRWLLEVSVRKNYAFVPINFIDIFSLIIRCLRRLDFILHFLIWLISLLVKRSHTLSFCNIIIVILV